MRRHLILYIAAFVQTLCLASTADSLRKVLPRLEGQQKSEAYSQLYQQLDGEENVTPILECLDEWIDHESKMGNIEEEAKVRWNKIVVMTNYATDSLLLAEVPQQMNWFMHHEKWEYYYDAWDSKVNVYLYTGHVQTALRESHNILDDANVRQNNFGRAVAYQQMGIIYESIGQYEQAVRVFKQCLGQLKDSYRDSEVLTNTYDYLCQTLYECNRFEEELKTTREWEKCIQERIRKNHKPHHSFLGTYIACRCNRALALTKLGQYEEAERELKAAEKLLAEQNTPLGRYRVVLVKAEHALAKGNAQQAQTYCDSLQHMHLDAGGNIELLQADIMVKMGRHAEAAQLFRNLFTAKDSTFTRDMRMQLDELNTLYQVDELEMESQLQRSYFMIGIGALLLVGLLLFSIFRFRASMKLEDEHAKLLESNKKLEQSYKELKVANQKAEESSRMKTDFIQQISHEIRTPLNILSGFTQIITTPNMELDEATLSDISQRITENTNRITGLVNKMLALSDANSRTMIECNDDVPAVQIATQAIDLSRIAQNTDVDFDILIAADAEQIMLHTHLQQATLALSMLLDNAQKFTIPRYANSTEKGKVWLKVEMIGKFVQFMVEDTGIGIPKKDANRIFEEFVQLDEFYDGTGIGLTIARSIARRMKGDVLLDTSYTDGARFMLRLPHSEKSK